MRALEDWLKKNPWYRAISLIRYDELDKKFEVYILERGKQVIASGDDIAEAIHNAVHKIEGVM